YPLGRRLIWLCQRQAHAAHVEADGVQRVLDRHRIAAGGHQRGDQRQQATVDARGLIRLTREVRLYHLADLAADEVRGDGDGAVATDCQDGQRHLIIAGPDVEAVRRVLDNARDLVQVPGRLLDTGDIGHARQA